MHANPTHLSGDVTFFGFTPQPQVFLQHELPQRLGLTPTVITLGPTGSFYYHTTYGEVAETDEAVVLKMGLVHSPQRSSISAQQLLEQGLITPRWAKAEVLRGSAVIACFSKKTPEFSIYKTLLSVPQLYFSKVNGGILCADGPKPHLALHDRVAINEEAVTQHFLFRYVLGRHSFFEDINRLLSGELFYWHDGQLETRMLRDLRPEAGSVSFNQADSQALAALYQEMSSVMGAYIGDMNQTGQGLGSLISGGVDSTVMQLFINDHVSMPEQRKSYSYIMETPGFEFEVDYVKDAIQALKTQHTFVSIKSDEYPELLTKTIETLGFPIPDESYPCKQAIAQFVEQNGGDVRYFFLGNGADSLHGTSFARKIALLENLRHIPAASPALKSIAHLINPIAAKKAHGLRQVAVMLPELNNPYSDKIPVNSVSVYSDIDMARRSFGDQALKKAFEYRQYLEALYLDSQHHAEKVHTIELVTDAYECGVVSNHLNRAHKCEQVYFFMDEDVVRIGLAFDPNIRLMKGRKVKPLLKGLLEQTPFAHIANKPKGASVFSDDLYAWMKNGPLRQRILDIERPGFLNNADFQKLLEVPAWSPLDQPNWFLWNLLTFDIFEKQVVNPHPQISPESL